MNISVENPVVGALHSVSHLIATLPKKSHFQDLVVATLSMKNAVYLILRISVVFRLPLKETRGQF